MDYIKRLRNLSKMNKWKFVVSELKSLQQDFQDDQAIAELFVEQKLLYGYNITKSKDQVYTA